MANKQAPSIIYFIFPSCIQGVSTDFALLDVIQADHGDFVIEIDYPNKPSIELNFGEREYTLHMFEVFTKAIQEGNQFIRVLDHYTVKPGFLK